MTAEKTPQPRKMRNVSTTFTIRDIAVVIGAAVAASGPFFAYDKRISVDEANHQQLVATVARLIARVDRINDIDQDIRSRVDRLEGVDDRLRDRLEILIRDHDQLKQDIKDLQKQK